MPRPWLMRWLWEAPKDRTGCQGNHPQDQKAGTFSPTHRPLLEEKGWRLSLSQWPVSSPLLPGWWDLHNTPEYRVRGLPGWWSWEVWGRWCLRGCQAPHPFLTPLCPGLSWPVTLLLNCIPEFCEPLQEVYQISGGTTRTSNWSASWSEAQGWPPGLGTRVRRRQCLRVWATSGIKGQNRQSCRTSSCRSCLVQETSTWLVASAVCRHRKQKSFLLYQQKPWHIACMWLWSWPVSFTKMVPVLLPAPAILPSSWDLYATGKTHLKATDFPCLSCRNETCEDQSEVCCLHFRSYKDTTMRFLQRHPPTKDNYWTLGPRGTESSNHTGDHHINSWLHIETEAQRS